jgi:hypothetical protein
MPLHEKLVLTCSVPSVDLLRKVARKQSEDCKGEHPVLLGTFTTLQCSFVGNNEKVLAFISSKQNIIYKECLVSIIIHDTDKIFLVTSYNVGLTHFSLGEYLKIHKVTINLQPTLFGGCSLLTWLCVYDCRI